jgi:hypothetical protein
MGLFCVNFHFRTADDRSVADAMSRRGITRYQVVPPRTGWTALYEERASEQDDRRILELGRDLSRELRVPAIAFLVHDSDIACYWLFDNGQLLDEYNSDPTYFDDTDGPPSPVGGQIDILLRYCRPGIQQAEVAAILAEEAVQQATFADEIIYRLAEVLGIDPRLATTDYRDVAGDSGPGGGNGTADDDDDDASGAGILPMRAAPVERPVRRLVFDVGSTSADARGTALVQAAACGDTATLDRLLAEGVPVNAEGLAPFPGRKPGAGLEHLFPGGVPQILMTPLLAAVLNKQRHTAERLLLAGADPNLGHPVLGAPIHAATGFGDVELLQLLLEHGADMNARNAQGHTPLQRLAASRGAMEALVQLQASIKTKGGKLPPQLANVSLPVEGWNACEQLLKAHGAR